MTFNLDFQKDKSLILDDYQDTFISQLSASVAKCKATIAQAETGSGKTVIFSAIANRFIQQSKKDVIIFVDRKELLNQTRKTLYKWYGILSQKIDAETKYIDTSIRVHVAMVETFNRRSNSTASFFDKFNNIGLVIIDEAHVGNFKKIILKFPTALRIGFTATPISASVKDPLINYWSDIVIGPTPKELVAINELNPKRGIVPALEYSMKGIDRTKFKKNSKGEYDEDQMGEAFSSKKQIQNTIDAIIKHGYNLKTICFNSNIKHSLEMHHALLEAGFNSRHLDGNKNGKYGNDRYREDCFRWLKEEPNAILNNVGIATTGFDEPSIECVIINSSIVSMSYFRQKRGRGLRPYQYPNGTFKKHCVVLDMGDNIVKGGHGEWHEEKDWKTIFFTPKEYRPGVSAIKSCPECGAINTASARICIGGKYDFLEDEHIQCGYIFPIKEKTEDTEEKEMVLISDGIDVQQNIFFFRDRKEYFSMYETIRQVANSAKATINSEYLDSIQLNKILNIAFDKSSQWYKIKGKRRPPNFILDVKDKLINNLKDAGFLITPEELEELNKSLEK